MKITINKLSILLCALTLSSCATSPDKQEEQKTNNTYNVTGSYLTSTPPAQKKQLNTQEPSKPSTNAGANKMEHLQSLARTNVNLRKIEQLATAFSATPSLTLSVNEMSMQNFLHYTFGELLNVNYIIDKSISATEQTVTLNIKEQISQRRLVQLTNELLMSHGIALKFNDGLYYIHKPEKSKKGQRIVTAVGRELSSVPQTAQNILQIVPLKFGVKISIERALRTLVGVKITTDSDQSALFLQGKREDILRSLEFIHLLDAPANRGKYIGLISLTYIESDEFTKQITLLLENEGIPVATNRAGGKNLVMVPIAQVGAIAVFAADKTMLNRVRYWAKIIDKPLQSLTKQYFMYHPQYARASDLGDSLSALLNGANMAGSSPKKPQPKSSTRNNSTGAAPSSKRTTGVSNSKITLVVDERANAIIFYTSGSEYQALLPLITKLDVLPRQVMLDITIAEVTLTDEFKHGVEWALSSGEVSMGTKGAFGAGAIGGFNLSINGIDGEINANFIETNSLVKVLSNPSILVRDGVSANINVGSDISVIGQTTEDPINGDRQTTKSEYRKTGVDITVTPSINAQGIVIMEISQKISNSVPDSTGAGGNPNIFERSLTTEVVAQSGQTIILGGLISENTNTSDKKTPWIADIPFIGNLFKSSGDSVNRTELIMLITPKVIDRTDQWQELTESFKQGLEYLTLDITPSKNNN
jgi:general secretion pathway protein D